MNDFVTIATYSDYVTASFDKQKLDERDIDSYLADENTITTQWILGNALGGIKLRVPGQQAEAALKILGEKEEEIKADFKIEEKEDDVVCTKCGSNNTGTEKYSGPLAGWTWMILGFPILVKPSNQHRCFYCGHTWKS